ncbi:MAG: Gfo/Idh/MocA family oxidoreductase [Bacteroidales bacterium]|nr:Gfo/Idh/MocA family oxidoreductase [Bacteroidales bacterium]
MPSRRSFLGQTVASAATLTVAPALPAMAPASAAVERLPIALMGCGGMGVHHLKNLMNRPDVDIRYVCDVDANRLASAARIVEAGQGHAPTPVKDVRRILDDKTIVAVWMATPDHWHTPGAVLAANAGKHVYVEKPCSHNVREGRLLVEAATRNKVQIQVGTQARSTKTCQEAMARLHGGAIGDILVAKAWNSQKRRNLGHVPPSQPPAYLDYDLWLGPAPEAPFYANRVPARWRYFFDYGAGDMGNDGVHNIDVAIWGLQVDRLPDRVTALGGKLHFDDDQQWPDTQYVVCEYNAAHAGGLARQLIYEQRIWSPYVQEGYENGNAFYGTKGCLIMGHTIGWKLYGERNKLLEEMTGPVDIRSHHTNFLEAIRSGAALNAPALAGHVAAGVCHLANISTRLGQTLRFDSTTETLPQNEPASALLKRAYRPGHWATPKGV